MCKNTIKNVIKMFFLVKNKTTLNHVLLISVVIFLSVGSVVCEISSQIDNTGDKSLGRDANSSEATGMIT